MMKTPCILFTGVNEVRVESTEIRTPAEGELLVETLYSAVSPGTELRCLAGRQDNLGNGFPFIPGYALVGRVLESRNASFRPGTVVFASGTASAAHRLSWGGHIGLAIVPEAGAVRLCGGIDPVEATLLKLAAIAHRGVVVSRPQPGQKVAVVGLGPIGQLAARLFRRAGARVIATDLSPARVALAQNAGIDAVTLGESINATIRATFPQGADIVVDATGHPAALRDCTTLVRDRPWADNLPESGKLVVQGSYSGEVPFPQDAAFLKELQVFWPRDCTRTDLELMAMYVTDGTLRMRDLMGDPVPAVQAPAIYEALRKQTNTHLTAAFAWAN